MSYSSQLTYARILECARQEFAAYGYEGANMRRIAQAAKATTGALCNHFANKAVLFDALVQAPAEEMLAQFQTIHQTLGQTLTPLSGHTLHEAGFAGTDWMLRYIYEHLDAFRLIFCHAQGTRWSTYLEQLIEIEERAYRTYCNAAGKDTQQIEDFFLHVTAATGFQYLVELVSHDLSYEQAVAVMNNVKRYHMAGWDEILGLRP